MRDLSKRVLANRKLVVALALGAVLALALGLRIYRLDGQSLWNDEGTSVALAGRSLSQITVQAAADIHPPLYHYILHFWLLLFGKSEVAVRSFSALCGVALVVVVYLWGRRAFGARAGLAAAFVAAISSYQVYYSQEARMYMLLTLLGALSSYLFTVAWLRREKGSGSTDRLPLLPALGWLLATIAAFYTHYLAFAVILAQNLVWLGYTLAGLQRRELTWGRAFREAGTWYGAQLLVALSFVPWLRLTWGQLNTWPGTSQPFGLLALLRQALPLFVLGPTAAARAVRTLVAAVLALALLGLLWPERAGRRSGWERLLAVLHWVVPVAVLYVLSRTRPVYHPKFLLLATPGLALLVGRGVARFAPPRQGIPERWLVVGRWGLAVLALVTVVAASLPGLNNYYYDARFARDDYRAIAQYIRALGRTGDVVLINAPSQIETVAYYYPGPLPLVPLPQQRPPDRAQVESELATLSQKAQRIFAIFWATNESDPERIVESWLDDHAYKALDAWYGNVRLVTYAMPSKQVGATPQHKLTVDLGGQVLLAGYSLPTEEVAAGDILQLTLYWQATNVIPRRYKVFTHVLDAAGNVVGQRDAEPGGGMRFTTTWRQDETIVDRYGLPILPGTPPGEYLIEVGMYNPEDGQRLPVVLNGQPAADYVILQKVRVVPAQSELPPAAVDMERRRTIKGDDAQLIGFSLHRLGSGEHGVVNAHASDTLELVLFWQALRPPTADGTMQLQLIDARGRVRWVQRVSPTASRYPMTSWQDQEIVRDPQRVPLAGLTPGRYRLRLQVPGGARLEELAAFEVK